MSVIQKATEIVQKESVVYTRLPKSAKKSFINQATEIAKNSVGFIHRATEIQIVNKAAVF